jgi:hypothetical protein
MAGGTDNNQLKAEADDTVAVVTAMDTETATEMATETATVATAMTKMPRQLWCIDNSDADDASGLCLAAKDCTIALAFPLWPLPTPPLPLLPPPLPPPPPPLLCWNVGGNGNDEDKDGSSGDGEDNNNGGNSGCVGGCTPLFSCQVCMQRCSKNWLTTATWGLPERSFQDEPTNCI